jgi:hypothetical protein
MTQCHFAEHLSTKFTAVLTLHLSYNTLIACVILSFHRAVKKVTVLLGSETAMSRFFTGDFNF